MKFLEKYKVNLDDNFSILVNKGPGSFSSIRIALTVKEELKYQKVVIWL